MQIMQEKHLAINSDSDFIDFHYCQNGIGTDLEAIRNHESGEIISKPWMVSDKEQDGLVTTAMVKRLECELGKMARSNVKGLAESAKYSRSLPWGLMERRVEIVGNRYIWKRGRDRSVYFTGAEKPAYDPDLYNGYWR